MHVAHLGTAFENDRQRGRMTIRSRWLVGSVGLLAAVAAVVLVARPAAAGATRMTIGAGLSSCPAGYVCLWTSSYYIGTGYAFYNSENNYATLPAPFNGIDNASYSFYSHGNTYDIRFYRTSTSSAQDSFVLCKGEAIPVVPASVELPDINTTGSGTWQNTVSRHEFGDWC